MTVIPRDRSEESMSSEEPPRMSAANFAKLFDSCKNWGRWPSQGDRGALNYITAKEVAAAAALVTRGRTVSCARQLDTVAGPDNGLPVIHHMTALHDVAYGEGGDQRFTGDYVGTEIHGDCISHIDALCHVVHQGQVFDGVPADNAVNSLGASRQSIDVAGHGIVSRGVLLDFPRLRGVPWLEPGEAISSEEFTAAEKEAGTQLRQGDIVFVRTGQALRRRTEGPWNVLLGQVGLDLGVMPILHERQVAALAADSDSDPAPSRCEGLDFPVHAIAVVAMGLHMIDHLDLDDLAEACAEEGRAQFMAVIAPLRIGRGTGSPVNPIAVL
jgi:kynurenine formamidase